MVNLLDATNPFKMIGQKKNPFSDSWITKKVENANVSTNTGTNSLPTPQSIEVKPTRESTSLLIKPLPAITAPSTPKRSWIDFSSIMPQPWRFDPLAQAKIGTRMPEIQNITAWPTQQDRVQSQVGVQNALDVRETNNTGRDNTVGEFLATIWENPEDDLENIRTKFPEFEGIDTQVLWELWATLTTNPEITMEEIRMKFPEIYGENYEKPNTSRMGGIKGNLASNGINLWLGEWVNPIGKVVEIVDDVVQKIPTLSTEEWDTYAKENLGWFGKGMWAVPTMVVNAIPSFLKTISGISRWVTNPADTMAWLYTLLSTEEWHQVLEDRYGGTEQLARTMTEDPVWLASDILTVVGWGSNVLGKAGQWSGKATWLSNLSNAGTKLSQFGNTAMNVADMGINAGLINKGIDLLPTKWLQRAANVITAPIQPLKTISDNTNIKKTLTRNIPEKVIENQLKLNPRERAKIENTWVTAAQFVLEKGIAWLSNEDKVHALQNIADESYNKVTEEFKQLPEWTKISDKSINNMLSTMIDEMESSAIVKREYWDYINTLKSLIKEEWFSPQEVLSIRRDFDSIIGKKIFDSQWRVSWLEDEIIAWYRSTANDLLQQLWEEYNIDMKDLNDNIRNSIAIRDGLLRSISQSKKNNYFWLQDLGIGAIWSMGNPYTALWIIGTKKIRESKSPWLMQWLYNRDKTQLTKWLPQKWSSFINKNNNDSRFNISNRSLNNSVLPEWQELKLNNPFKKETPSNKNPFKESTEKLAKSEKASTIDTMSKNNPIINKKTVETLDEAISKLEKNNWSKKDIDNYRKAVLSKNTKLSKDPNILDNLNPTWWLYVDYSPAKRASMKLADNITTLDKTMGVSPNKEITIYRWTIKNQKDIVAWDFITDNYDLAKSYAGEWHVISKKVKASDVLDDINEPLWNEYIYKPKQANITERIQSTNVRDAIAKADDVKPSIPKDLQPLYDEARKYKSAEEMIKNNIYYRWETWWWWNYYSTDFDFARDFTPSWLESEVKKAHIIPDDILIEKELPSANNEKEISSIINKAKKLWKRAIMVSEGKWQPNSIFVFDKSSIKTESQLRKIREEANK